MGYSVVIVLFFCILKKNRFKAVGLIEKRYYIYQMQFENPSILYALFSLLIPIIVHLFQLRRFQKTAFTNVKFLKELDLQTRKSSQLKKWLTLLARIAIFTCIILAFAQPYFSNHDHIHQQKETVIYLDNSLSMQAKGAKGKLLPIAIQDLLENFPSDEKITVITNNNIYKNTTIEALKDELINLKNSPTQLNYKTLSLKANQLFSSKKNTQKRFIAISDFQNNSPIDTSLFNTNIQHSLIQTLPVKRDNISIDSAYITTNLNNNTLTAILKNQNSVLQTIPISLFQNDRLISKVSADISSDKNLLAFPLPNTKNLNIKLVINHNDLSFDNELFLTKTQPKKINVLAIGDLNNNAFLKKVFTKNEFQLIENSPLQIEYATFPNQHLIVLNEIENLSAALIQNIQTFEKNGGTVLVIPHQSINLQNYQLLLPNYSSLTERETRVTKLNYSHPILKEVFEKQVTNFQYPFVKEHYQLKNYETLVLGLENKAAFLVQYKNYYLFAAALNKFNSNIKQAPIIVPTLYNVAKSSLKNGQSYLQIGQENTIDIPIQLHHDEVLHITSSAIDFIPLQEIKGNKVRLFTHHQPKKAAVYAVQKNDHIVRYLAYNYLRSESRMNYHNIENLNNNHITTSSSVSNRITEINSLNEVVSLWKWFIIFALIFLAIELLILKYL